MPVYARIGMHLLFYGPAQVCDPPRQHAAKETYANHRFASYVGVWFVTSLRLSLLDVSGNRHPFVPTDHQDHRQRVRSTTKKAPTS